MIPSEILLDNVVNFYDFNRAKLVRMEEDGEENDEISESDTEGIFYSNLFTFI